jgi:hypothetical protein
MRHSTCNSSLSDSPPPKPKGFSSPSQMGTNAPISKPGTCNMNSTFFSASPLWHRNRIL